MKKELDPGTKYLLMKKLPEYLSLTVVIVLAIVFISIVVGQVGRLIYWSFQLW